MAAPRQIELIRKNDPNEEKALINPDFQQHRSIAPRSLTAQDRYTSIPDAGQLALRARIGLMHCSSHEESEAYSTDALIL
jgi:hypothetical protein